MYSDFCRNPALNESGIFTQQEVEFISHFFFAFSSQRPPKKPLSTTLRNHHIFSKVHQMKEVTSLNGKHPPEKMTFPCCCYGTLNKNNPLSSSMPLPCKCRGMALASTKISLVWSFHNHRNSFFWIHLYKCWLLGFKRTELLETILKPSAVRPLFWWSSSGWYLSVKSISFTGSPNQFTVRYRVNLLDDKSKLLDAFYPESSSFFL